MTVTKLATRQVEGVGGAYEELCGLDEPTTLDQAIASQEQWHDLFEAVRERLWAARRTVMSFEKGGE